MRREVQAPAVEAKRSKGRGRGLFATRQIARGETIMSCPVIVIPADETDSVDETTLVDYVFWWGVKGDQYAMCLGLGSLINHAYQPNARYWTNYGPRTIDFIALRDIEPGEELFVNYNGDPEDQTPVWFDAN